MDYLSIPGSVHDYLRLNDGLTLLRLYKQSSDPVFPVKGAEKMRVVQDAHVVLPQQVVGYLFPNDTLMGYEERFAKGHRFADASAVSHPIMKLRCETKDDLFGATATAE